MRRIVDSLAATALGGDFDPETAPAGFVDVVLQATECDSLEALEAALSDAPEASAPATLDP